MAGVLKKDKYGMNPKQRRFVDKMLICPDRNAAKAYIDVYKPKRLASAAVSATKLLKKANIQQYISKKDGEVLDKLDLSHERIMQEYARLALFDVRKLYDENGTLLAIPDLDDDTAAAIAGLDVSVNRIGGLKDDTTQETRKFKIADKRGALDSVAKIRGMFEKDNAQKSLGDTWKEILSELKT